MEFIEVIGRETEALAARAIARWGYAPEHNLGWYLACGGEWEASRPRPGEGAKNIFVHFKNGFGLLTKEDKGNIYSVFSEPLAPPESRILVLKEYLEYIFSRFSPKKASLDLIEETRAPLLKALPPRLRARAPSAAYSLVSPMVNIRTFDFTLAGSGYKRLRNERAKFLRAHVIETADAGNIGKKELCGVIDRWRASRKARGRVAGERYYNFVASGFRGAERARGFFVDGKLIGFTAGWPIPNSSVYYPGVVLHDYSVPSAGIMLYWETFEWLRNASYTHIDLGGGDKPVTDFKNQFHPESWHNSYVFSVVRK